MRYLLLIYGDESQRNPGDEDMAAWGPIPRRFKTCKLMQGGEALQPTATATTVQSALARPYDRWSFAETKEQLAVTTCSTAKTR
jgi:hypothetical protein